MQPRDDIPLSSLTTFRIGGRARHFVEVRTADELREACAWAEERGVRFTILGGGSNVLVSDEGFDGLVIHIVSRGMSWEGELLTVQAGEVLLEVIRNAAGQGFGGWEKLAGIPGTVGGAVRGNAGAFGQEIKDFLISATALDTSDGSIRTFSLPECAFGYRQSFFKQHPHWIILSAEFNLMHKDSTASSTEIAATIAEREKRHLQDVRAAGSYFMNPVAPAHIVAQFEDEKGVRSREQRVPAGWLIEKAGFKGATLGGAQSSLQHPNYIINATGSATAHDVLALADTIKAAVREQFGIELTEEAALFA